MMPDFLLTLSLQYAAYYMHKFIFIKKLYLKNFEIILSLNGKILTPKSYFTHKESVRVTRDKTLGEIVSLGKNFRLSLDIRIDSISTSTHQSIISIGKMIRLFQRYRTTAESYVLHPVIHSWGENDLPPFDLTKLGDTNQNLTLQDWHQV